MFDDAGVFLRGARQKTRNVHEGDDRDVEAIAEAHEARGLARGVVVEHARKHHGLIGDEAHRPAFDAAETGDDVAREGFADLEEVALVRDFVDQLFHVVRLVRIFRHQRVEAHLRALRRVVGRPMRRLLAVVERQEIEEAAQLFDGDDIVLECAIRHGGFGGVHFGAAQLFGRHVFLRHRLHNIGTGDEHVGRVLHHEDEVCHGGRIDVAARARAHDHGNLRHHAGRQHVALEHFAITGERGDAFLDARAARIQQADHRRTVLHRHVLDLADLLGMGFGERAAEHGEILRINVSHAAIDRAPTGDDAIAGDDVLVRAEIGVAVLHEHVELLEGIRIEQQLDALAGGELALGMLRLDALFAAPGAGAVTAFFEFSEDVFHGMALAGKRQIGLQIVGLRRAGQAKRRRNRSAAESSSAWRFRRFSASESMPHFSA